LPISREGDLSVIWLVGDQDLATVPVLEATHTKALALDTSHLAIDLSRTAFIDAATIGALIRGRTAFEMQSRNLTVRTPSQVVRRV
jgi:anti-anti-sigma regulatory factor